MHRNLQPTPHHTTPPLAHYGEIQTEEDVLSASRHLKDAIMQIFTQTACQNSVCSGFWKLRKIGIMRSPRFAFSRSMKILQKTWPNALSVRLRPTNIDSERVAAQTSKQATVSSHTNISRHHLLCGLTRARMTRSALAQPPHTRAPPIYQAPWPALSRGPPFLPRPPLLAPVLRL